MMTKPSMMASARRERRGLPFLPSGGHSFSRLLLLLLLLSGGCAVEDGPPLGGDDPRIAQVEEGLTTAIRIRGREPERFTVTDRMAHYRVPGVSVAVLEDGAVAWARGYGVKDVETGEPVTPETLFQAASISKPVAALAALRLVERGELELDAPVNQSLRGWTIPENDFTYRQPVTLRHLLTHTGGLTVHGFPGYAVTDPIPDLVEILDGEGPCNTAPIRVDTLPGSLWRYSGGGYTILQKLLEDVTGEPFPVLMRELVLDPVGMTLSSYEQPLPPEREIHAASAHLGEGQRVEGRWHLYPEMAAAGLWTNPVELARLAVEVQESWGGEPGNILSQAMAREMLMPGPDNQGLGFAVRKGEGPTRFGHGGSNEGFKAQLQAFVEGGQGAVVMTNGEQGSQLAQEILTAVAEAYGWPISGPRLVDVVELQPDQLQRVAGTYRIEAVGVTVQVEVEEDHLRTLVVEAGEEDRFYALSETRFLGLGSGEAFEVVLDDEGQVTALSLERGVRATRVEG